MANFSLTLDVRLPNGMFGSKRGSKQIKTFVGFTLAGFLLVLSIAGYASNHIPNHPKSEPTGRGVTWQVPSQDMGDLQEIQKVKVQIKKLLPESYVYGNKVSVDSEAQKNPHASRQVASRKKHLSEIWDQSRTQGQETLIEKAIDFQIKGNPFPVLTHARLNLDEWQGIQINGNEAKVQLQGHIHYFDGNNQSDDPIGQWQLTLTRADAASNWVIKDRLFVMSGGY